MKLARIDAGSAQLMIELRVAIRRLVSMGYEFGEVICIRPAEVKMMEQLFDECRTLHERPNASQLLNSSGDYAEELMMLKQRYGVAHHAFFDPKGTVSWNTVADRIQSLDAEVQAFHDHWEQGRAFMFDEEAVADMQSCGAWQLALRSEERSLYTRKDELDRENHRLKVEALRRVEERKELERARATVSEHQEEIESLEPLIELARRLREPTTIREQLGQWLLGVNSAKD